MNVRALSKRQWSVQLLTQPLVGIVTSAVSVGVLAASWIAVPPAFGSEAARGGYPLGAAALAAVLTVALVLSHQFPVHIRYVTKIYMGSVPLYLMAVLLPPPLAALVAGLGQASSEVAAKRKMDTEYADIATQAGRWVLVELLGSAVAHASAPGFLLHGALLVATAAVLQAGDVLTAPLAVVPITGERPRHVIAECARGVGLPEAGQYFMGLIGVILAAQDIWACTLLILPIALVYQVSKRAKEMHETTRRLLESMADRVDQRDPYTHFHSKRVMKRAQDVLRELNVVGPEARLIVTAARVHDVGKIAIPEQVLHKAEALTSEEWAVIQSHPAVGAEMIANYPAFARGAEIVRSHHERWDGQGYPDGLTGTDIPFGARVIAVADGFDAMTSDRPYRKGMSAEQAAAILKAGAGTQWDPRVVEAFLRTIANEVEQPIPGALGRLAAGADGTHPAARRIGSA